MKINIDMEAWELATVIKVLTINDQPEEKKSEGVKPFLSDKTREELRRAFANAFRGPERLISEDNPNPNYRPPMGGKPTCS